MDLVIVTGPDGKLQVLSASEVNGGPKDFFVALDSRRHFIIVETAQEAEEFLREDGGKIYWYTHHDHNGEWIPARHNLMPKEGCWKEVKP